MTGGDASRAELQAGVAAAGQGALRCVPAEAGPASRWRRVSGLRSLRRLLVDKISHLLGPSLLPALKACVRAGHSTALVTVPSDQCRAADQVAG